MELGLVETFKRIYPHNNMGGTFDKWLSKLRGKCDLAFDRKEFLAYAEQSTNPLLKEIEEVLACQNMFT